MTSHFSAATIGVFVVIVALGNALPAINTDDHHEEFAPADLADTSSSIPQDDQSASQSSINEVTSDGDVSEIRHDDDIDVDSLPSPDSESESDNVTGNSNEPDIPTHNGRVVDDVFYKYYSDPSIEVPDIVDVALSWDPSKQRHHFEYLHHRLQAGQDDAQRAAQVLQAAQQLLDQTLRETKSPIPLTLDKYIDAMCKLQNGTPLEDKQLEGVLRGFEKYKLDTLEKATNAGSLKQENYHLSHLNPFQTSQPVADAGEQPSAAEDVVQDLEQGDVTATQSQQLYPN